MSKNERLFSVYRIFGYDYLFYTVIIFLFMTQTKGVSVGEFMHIAAFYAIFSAIMQIPCNYIVELIGLKKSIMLGNIFLIIHCVIYIFSPTFAVFVIAEFFCAMGFCLKNASESPLLFSTLKRNGRKAMYSKIEGKSVSKFFYIEALSSCIVGFLFNVNNYIPIFFTLASLITALIFSTRFEDMPIEKDEEHVGIKDYFKGIRLVAKSKRTRAIFSFAFILTGIIEVAKTLQKDSVVALNVGPVTYSIIFALLTFCMGLGSSIEYRFEKYTKRKTLGIIGFSVTILLLLLGLFMRLFNVSEFLIISVVVILVFENLFQGIYRISLKKYLTNFTTSSVRSRIFSVYYMFEALGKATFLFASGYIINALGTNYTSIIIGVAGILLVIISLKFMSKRLGLNPEEYSSDDIFGYEIK